MHDPKKEAKDFILRNSSKWQEADENGYHLTMDEDEILDWMVRFREAHVSTRRVQNCVTCAGSGQVPSGCGAATTNPFTVCPTCKGARVLII